MFLPKHTSYCTVARSVSLGSGAPQAAPSELDSVSQCNILANNYYIAVLHALCKPLILKENTTANPHQEIV